MSTHKRNKSRLPSGRVAFDDRGNATWEWHGEAARVGGAIDTEQLREIAGDLSCEAPDHGPGGATAHDPYNRVTAPESNRPRPKKRSIDDLRRLSEEIKAAPYWKDRRPR